MDAKSCKIQKTLHFTHFDKKSTHINRCKIVQKYTNATVTVHICTVTVALAFNIYIYIYIYFFSLSLIALTLTSLSLFLIWSNHQTSKTIKPLATLDLLPPPLISRRSPRSLSDCHSHWSLANRHKASLITSLFLCFSLFDQWVLS